MIERIIDFLLDIKSADECFFIEAEAIPNVMANFIIEYNNAYTPMITQNSEGVICLQECANKWGLELRLYVPAVPPTDIAELFCMNKVYRTEFSHRLNDNRIIRELFNNGFRIGIN